MRLLFNFPCDGLAACATLDGRTGVSLVPTTKGHEWQPMSHQNAPIQPTYIAEGGFTLDKLEVAKSANAAKLALFSTTPQGTRPFYKCPIPNLTSARFPRSKKTVIPADGSPPAIRPAMSWVAKWSACARRCWTASPPKTSPLSPLIERAKGGDVAAAELVLGSCKAK